MSKATYEAAKAQYKKLGIDTEKAIKTLKKISISMHCWQGDDVGGFETTGGASGRWDGWPPLPEGTCRCA